MTTPAQPSQSVEEGEVSPAPWWPFLFYFLRLGTFGFGGPIALAGYMQRDLVERRRWISKRDYLQGLARAQLAPGPLAAQLAIYLGWVRGGVGGATLVAAAFILPSFVMVLGISALYVRYGGLPWMQGVFYGVGAAGIAVSAGAAIKLVKLTLARDRLLWGLFAISAVATAWTESEIIWLFLASGVVVLIVRAAPRWGAPAATGALLPFTGGKLSLAIAAAAPFAASFAPSWPMLGRIALYFAEAGSFVFGSGLAIVPFMHGGVGDQFPLLLEPLVPDKVPE